MVCALIRVLTLACLLVASCSRAGSGEPEARLRPAPEQPEAEEPDEPALPEPDPSSTCGHALACCRAYASAIPDVVEESACSGVREAAAEPDADRRCSSMTAGWRQALEHLSGEAPEACRRELDPLPPRPSSRYLRPP